MLKYLLFCFAYLFFFTSAQELLNVHVIAHTHDDVGWLKTVDEYYYGANQSIQDAGVQYILDGVVEALIADPNKKFIYVEIAFFFRWWREQTPSRQDQVRQLVTSGQLEFINGGWCMNDEANTYYPAIIAQMSEGHQFLLREFGVTPRIGWHIDPFGHAATQASLFAEMGFDAFFFWRIDYNQKTYFNETKELEFVWSGSKSLGAKTEIWTHVLYSDYCYLHGFNFESGDAPIQDDPELFDLNVMQRSDLFSQMIHERASSYRTNNVMAPFGCDFQYENANMNFKNIDKLISYINANPDRYGINMFYSTPSIYTDAVNAANISWNVYTGDFFPYADDGHSYWSGYFTSRPALKGYVRYMDNFLHGVDKLFVTASAVSQGTYVNVSMAVEGIDVLGQAFSVAQHHDAVAGTEKQHVADDYAKRLSIGEVATQEVMAEVLQAVISNGTNQVLNFTFCRLLNVSICPATAALASGEAVPIVVYNPVAWNRTHFVRVVIPIAKVDVLGPDGVIIPADVFQNGDYPDQFTMVFPVFIHPLGFNVYTLQQGSGSENFYPQRTYNNSVVVMENEYLNIIFNTTTNKLEEMNNKVVGLVLSIDQQFWWWNASTGNNNISTQASGAYIFRPNGTTPFPVNPENQPTSLSMAKGMHLTEVYQEWNGWISQTFQLYVGEPLVHTEATIGPIDISDGLGKEVVTRFSTSLNTNQLWYTDSEGDEMQERQLNTRSFPNNITEPIASNYYPMNTAAFIQDTNQGSQFTVITDRSRGCTSLANGEIENMLHRRLLVDDGRGVGEPLNETEAIRTAEYLIFDSITDSSNIMRLAALLMSHQPFMAFTSVSDAQKFISTSRTTFAPLNYPLPGNVHMTSLKALPDGNVILRLHHIFAVGEDEKLSLPVKVDLNTLFTDLIIEQIVETPLTATMPISDLHRLSWNTNSQSSYPKHDKFEHSEGIIVLNPMETRTFLVRFMSI